MMKNFITGSISYLYLSIPSPSQSTIDELLRLIVSACLAMLSQYVLRKMEASNKRRRIRKGKPPIDKAAGLILAVIVMAQLLGCSTTKRTRESHYSRNTATVERVADLRKDSSYVSRRIELSDSLVKIGAKFVSGTLKLSDLVPAYTAAGKPVVQTFTQKKDGITATLKVNPDSTVEYSAQLDSMFILIQDLRREVVEVRSAVLQSRDSSKTTEDIITWRGTFNKIRTNWLVWLPYLAIFIGLLFIPDILQFIVKKFRKNV